MKKEFKVWAITCIVLWWLTPNKALSQQDSLQRQYLEEVVISAGKFPKERSQNGRVVDIIDRDEILTGGSRDIGQLLQSRTGIFVNGANSAPSKERGIYLRGASPQYSLIMIDGIPVYDPSGVNGVFDLRLLSLNNVEQIEILKGSQSTLYGTDAMAGVINIITRDGEEGFHPAASVSYGSYNQLNADASVTGRHGGISYTTGYSYWQSGGISEARAPSEGDSFEEDSFTQHAVNASIGADINDNISLSSFIKYSRMDGDYDAGPFSDAPGNRYEGDNLYYGLSLMSAAPNGWQVQVAQNRLDRTFSSDFGDFSSTGNLWHVEGFYTHNFSEAIRILGGLMFQRQDISSEEINDARILAPYITLFFAPVPGLNLEGGVRLNHHSEFGNEVTFSINPSWQISPGWKIFGNYTTGFKAPTLNQLYGQFGPNPDLVPEISRSIEAGISWNKNGSDIRLILFDRRIDDIIIFTDRYINSDRQDVRGIELEPSFRIGEKTLIRAGYTYLDGETILSSSDSTFTGILRQPAHAARLSVEYSPARRLRSVLEAQYFGKRNDIFFNTESFTNQTVLLDPYLLINFRLSYQVLSSGLWVQGSVRNIFDVDYYEVYGYSVLGRNIQLGLRWGL